jgi:hypothetical protein
MLRAVLVAAVVCAGCTYDFDFYLPNGAALDATAVDAPVDTAPACTPDGGDACYATARGCGGMCAATRGTCEAACTNAGCRKTCRDAETSCKATCVNACTTCTTTGGCATTARCATEVAS